MFDGERFTARPTVLVDGATVLAVGEAIPASVATIDLPGSTVLPGLIDCHQHLCFHGRGTLEEQVAEISDDDLRTRAAGAARAALAGGVTALRDLGDRNYVTLDLRGEAGLPTVVAAGPPITITSGHCWYLGGECTGKEGLRNAVRQRVERGCDVVKVMVTGGALTPTYPMWESQFSTAEVRLIVDEAHRHGLPVATHCHGIDGIRSAVDAGVDSIEHCTFMNEGLECAPPDELLERIVAAGIALSATFGERPVRTDLPEPWATNRPIIAATVGRIHAAGGVIVVGTDAGINEFKPHDVLPSSMEVLASAGLSATESLRALTSAAARLCGLPSKGHLQRGADADLIAVDGDPGSDPTAITRISHVWHAGRQVR